MIAPIAIEPAENVAVDSDAEILADFASGNTVVGIECLSMESSSRAALLTFAQDHALTLRAEIDTFALSDLP